MTDLPETEKLALPSLESGRNVGEALKAVREHQGLSLERLADLTRIRRTYLAAIEEMALHTLPSRPFTIGYVRAYAAALGMDGEAAVARFKLDDPLSDQGLREPVGLRQGRDPRLGAIVLSGLLIIAAIIVWNITRRTGQAVAPSHVQSASAPVVPVGPQGPIVLGPPLPAPVESTIPPPYETPGLAASVANGGTVGGPALAAVPNPGPSLRASFTPQGPIYGAAEGSSPVLVQALKSTSLIVRDSTGATFFARQLAAGEAYRPPMIAGTNLEVVEGSSLQVFVGGASRGVLPLGRSSVTKLAETQP